MSETKKPDLLAIVDSMSQIVELVKGYESTLEASFPDMHQHNINEAVVQFHGMVMAQIAAQAKPNSKGA